MFTTCTLISRMMPIYPFYTSEAATGDDQTGGSAPPGREYFVCICAF